MIKGIFIGVITIISFWYPAKAQDKNFLQYRGTILYMNPAFTGTNPWVRASLVQRIQYPQIPGAFATTLVTYDHNLPRQRSSFGLLASLDNSGFSGFRSVQAEALYAFLVPIKSWRIKMGLSAGFGNKTLNYLNYVYGDQINSAGQITSVPTQDQTLEGLNLNYWDISSGLLVYNKSLWFGFAAHHLNEPTQSFINTDYRLPRRYSAHGGWKVPLSSDWKNENFIHSQFLYRHQAGLNQLDVGFDFQNAYFRGGLWYRNIPIQTPAASALGIVAEFRHSYFQIGYGFELPFGQLSRSGGAHELRIGYQFDPELLWERKVKYISLPAF